MNLTTLLQQYEPFQSLPKPNQAILHTLASRFQESPDHLFMSPDELQSQTDLGTVSHWETLLNLEPTNTYIKAQMSAITQIAQRKSFQALLSQAISGNTQAAKQIQEISGILTQGDNNKVVVLTHIPRPKKEVNNE